MGQRKDRGEGRAEWVGPQSAFAHADEHGKKSRGVCFARSADHPIPENEFGLAVWIPTLEQMRNGFLARLKFFVDRIDLQRNRRAQLEAQIQRLQSLRGSLAQVVEESRKLYGAAVMLEIRAVTGGIAESQSSCGVAAPSRSRFGWQKDWGEPDPQHWTQSPLW